MIPLEDFFDRIHFQLDNKLPVVVYKKPEEEIIHAIPQNDNTLSEVKNFSESGFVFSPFNTTKKSPLLIPLSNAKPVSTFFIPSESHDASKIDVSESLHYPLRKVDHIEVIERALNEISSGKMQKVIISRTEKIDVKKEDSVMTLFKKLLNTYLTAFVYLWYHPKVGMWMGATPETLLKVEGNQFKTVALAGTQPFNGDMEVDWGDKEINEQQMVVNSIVKKLEKETKALRVSGKFTVRAGNILHLQTNISGKIKPSDSETSQNEIQNLIEALHPTAAVCGLPKEEAKQFILKNEAYNREFYTGYLGELNIPNYKITKGDLQKLNTDETISNIFVNLRCMKIIKNKALIYVGGGITKDSEAESEWEETVSKTKVMKKVLF